MTKKLTGPALVAYLRDNPTSDAMRAAADEIERLRKALKQATDALAGGLWDYGPGQDEHEQCEAVIERCRATLGEEMNTHDIETVLRSYLTGDGYIAADDIPAICAAIEAALQSQDRELQTLRAVSAEYNELIRHLHSGGDALEFISSRRIEGE